MADLILYSDAKAKFDRFGICGPDGQPVWYGVFINDHSYKGHQASAELAAAIKAVWLAKVVRDTLRLQQLDLRLWVDAQWLTYKTGPKSRKVWERADAYDIGFRPLWLPGLDNPADEFTICNGYMQFDSKQFRRWVDLSAGVLEVERKTGKHFHGTPDVREPSARGR